MPCCTARLRMAAEVFVLADSQPRWLSTLTSYNCLRRQGVMCRDTVSVGWDGRLYDCDFNQQLELGLRVGGRHRTVFDVQSLDELTGVAIGCDNHCFGCTAGAGSSCQGAAE